jgi:hypothetical protein
MYDYVFEKDSSNNEMTTQWNGRQSVAMQEDKSFRPTHFSIEDVLTLLS